MDKTTVAGSTIIGGLLLASALVSPASEFVLITEDGERTFPTQHAAEAAAENWIAKKNDKIAERKKIKEFTTSDGALKAIVEERPKRDE